MLLLATACDVPMQGWSLPLPQCTHSQRRIGLVSCPKSALSWPCPPAKERPHDPESKSTLGSLETVGINPTCKVPYHLRPGDLGWASPSSSFTFCSSFSLAAHLLWYIHHVAFCYFYHMAFHHLLCVSADDIALCKVRVWPPTRQSILLFPFTPSLPMWFLKAGKTEIIPI